jgi:DNA-binding NarL/FixJ family response regulator
MRVVIADDTALLREGLVRLLVDRGVDVCGDAGNAEDLLELVAAHSPDVAIVDIRMPPGYTTEGLAAAETIHEHHPETGVLVLSQYLEPAYALRVASGEGGRGYLLKDRVTDAAELVIALGRVAAGEIVVDAELVQHLLTRPRSSGPLDELTPREREVLGMMAEGLTDRGIAERLWLTPRTVETHVRHVLQKLELSEGTAYNRRVQAVLAYLRIAEAGGAQIRGPAGGVLERLEHD